MESADLFTKLISRSLSNLYLAAGTLRNICYDKGVKASQKLPGKVFSVGNIAVGGTGKSPTILALLAYLKKLGAKPAVLTRGYGSDLRGPDWLVFKSGKIVGGNSSCKHLPDEARMQSMQFPDVPIIAGPSRYKAAKAFLQDHPGEHPTHWLLDDGFQHRSLSRDLDIVLMDKSNPFGNRRVLPYGMLREPISSLARADHIVFTGYGLPVEADLSTLKREAPNVPVSYAENISVALEKDVSEKFYFSEFADKQLLLVAGIARPERLRHDLEIANVQITKEWILPDHGQVEISALNNMATGMAAVVTTSKDYWRNPDVFDCLQIPVFVKKTQIVLPESLLTSIS